MKYVGIDLGTTYSCISVLDEVGKEPKVIDVMGKQTTPSVVYFKDDGTIVVGMSAKNRRKMYRDNVIEFAKRYMIREGHTFSVAGKSYTPVDISSYILRELFNSFKKSYPNDEFRCTITCPAGYDLATRNLVKDAAQKAGIGEVSLVNEPTAAAISYCESEGFTQGGLMVFDLGGGTLDVTVLYRHGDGTYDVIASEGKDELGGMDWDNEVESEIYRQASESLGISVDELKSDKNISSAIDTKAEEIKKELSVMDFEEEIEIGDDYINFVLSQADFEAKTKSHLDVALSLIGNVLEHVNEQAQQRGIDSFSIDKVVLVGGSCYMPQVTNGIENQYPQFKGKIVMHEPDLAISKGAAHYSRMTNDSQYKEHEGEVLREALSRTFGTDVLINGVTVCDNLLFKNDPIPTEIVRVYSLRKGQTRVSNKVFVNAARDKNLQANVPVEDCKVMNDFDMELPFVADDGEPVEITFSVSTEGILTATGRCRDFVTSCIVTLADKPQ